MNFIHLVSLSLLALNFSGRPVSNTSPVPVERSVMVSVLSEPSADGNEMIPWAPTVRLNWEDFKCEPKLGTDAVASTSTSLGIAYQMVNGKLSYHISCNFSKNRSWGLMKTEYILAHEQGHFDITEIFARKLNEALQNYEFNRKTFKSDINEIYQSIVAQKEQYQQQYDGETDHSRNKRIQYEWLDKIQTLLTETEVYATYP
jgi:hypothetical protein